MVLSWSRALYVEFIEKADTPAFIRCHLKAFNHFGGIPTAGLYDSAKVVVLGRDDAGEVLLNPSFLDFRRRVGMGVKLCRPYRSQTKGRVEGEAKAWAKTVGEQLEAEWARPMLDALSALQPRGKKQRLEVRKAIDYFTANGGRMDYLT